MSRSPGRDREDRGGHRLANPSLHHPFYVAGSRKGKGWQLGRRLPDCLLIEKRGPIVDHMEIKLDCLSVDAEVGPVGCVSVKMICHWQSPSRMSPPRPGCRIVP